MNELRNSKSDDQLEELLMLTEQMQEELDQKDRTIRELKMQLDESLTLNERLNRENRAGNIQALKNDLRKTKELLQSEKEAETPERACAASAVFRAFTFAHGAASRARPRRRCSQTLEKCGYLWYSLRMAVLHFLAKFTRCMIEIKKWRNML